MKLAVSLEIDQLLPKGTVQPISHYTFLGLRCVRNAKEYTSGTIKVPFF